MKMEMYEIVMGLYTVMMVAVIIALTLWIWGEIKDRINMKKIVLQKMEKKEEGLKTKEAEEANDGK